MQATWQWNDSNGVIGGATNSTYTAVSSGAYSVTITTAAGCSSTSEPFSLSLEPPTAGFSADVTEICQGESVTFTGRINEFSNWMVMGFW